ncbi:MAG: PAS domain S-box protein [Anaerolineales bacterium]
MNREEFFYLLPYLFSLALSLGIFFYAWRHRLVRGVRAYTWFVGGQVLYIVGFLLELISPNLQTKLLWDKFQWLVESAFVFIPFLAFSLQFSDHKLKNPRLMWAVWIGVPLLFILLVLTDGYHHLLYPNPSLSADQPFPELQYDFTTVVIIYAIFYVYSVNLFGIGVLIKRALQPYNLYRSQYLVIALGFSIPLFLSVFSFTDIRITPQRDITPFSLVLGNLVVAWGLFRYRLFDIVPIAREKIVENMLDPVIVLDAQNRIVDINTVALSLLGKQMSEVIGQSSASAFTRWPMVVELIENPAEQRKEISAKSKGDTVFFDISISPIIDKRTGLVGRIVVARDITRRKNLEMNYRSLSQELEERIHERTEELRKSVEMYRTVVENQTEFIVRWKPDRTRTFVNEAYCRHFGLTMEQAMQIDFVSLIAEEDRPRVQEKIARLSSGETETETDIHRVPLPDGSVGWQEWTDRAIRDETGNVVEFQSIGRDITERKRAEEALRESEAIYRKAIEVAGGVPYRQSYHYYEGFHLHIVYDFIGEGIQQITGYGPQEITEDLWDSLVKETVLTGELSKYTLMEAIQRVRDGSSPVWQCEHRIRTRQGETRWIYEVAVELREKDGISHGSIGLLQDITERKRAEEAIRTLSYAVEQSNTSIVITDITGRIEYVNPYFTELTGYTPEEVIGKNPRMLQSGFTQKEVYDRLWKTLKDGREWQGEFCNRKKSGELYWESASISPIVDSTSGNMMHFVAVKTDITDRKRAEIALQKSEKKHRLLFESANDSIFIMKGDRFIDCNSKTLEMFRCRREDILGKSPVNFSPDIQPDGIASSEKAVEKIQAVQEGNPQFFEWKHCRPDNTFFDAEVSLSQLELEDGIYIQAIVRDITLRKQAEEALRKSEERFSKAFRASPIIITISQISTAKLLEVNDTFEKISGYSRAEAIGKSTFDLGIWKSGVDRDRILSSILNTGEIRNLEIQFRIKDGSVLTCLFSADKIELGGEQCILATIEDISERKKAEARILRLNRLYVTISEINQTIVHAHDKDDLFREICRVATDHGQFRMAWIGLFNETGKEVKPVVFAGEELGYLSDITISYDQGTTGSGPTGVAVREGHCVISQDIATDPRMVPWREEALSRGYRSSAAVPIREHGQIIGALTVYAPEPNGFDSENEELLEQIGLDVSFALDSIEAENKRNRAEQNLADAYDTTLEGWAKALELRDKETEGHSRRVTETTLTVARAMGFSEAELVHIRRGSILHDIGKMGIPDDILRKNGPLTEEDKNVVVKHPITAYELLKPIAYLKPALDIPYCHHEKWDGSGYPRALKGEQIPLAARIFAVVDVWDALSSDRPYRSAWSREKVADYLRNESGKHFDPRVVDVFLKMLEKGEI